MTEGQNTHPTVTHKGYHYTISHVVDEHRGHVSTAPTTLGSSIVRVDAEQITHLTPLDHQCTSGRRRLEMCLISEH